MSDTVPSATKKTKDEAPTSIPQATGQAGKSASSISKTSPFVAAMQTSISRPIGLASMTAPPGGQQQQPSRSLYQEKSPLSVKRSALQAAAFKAYTSTTGIKLTAPPAALPSSAEEMDESEYLESLIEKLMQFTGNASDHRLMLDEKELLYVIAKMEFYYRSKGALVEAAAPVTIVGDIHGQFRDLKRILKHSGMPPDTRYVFLGDYVDRGPFGIETVTLIFLFKLRYPGDIFVLRGNHETASTNAVYGFFEECCKRYNSTVWCRFQKAFDSLPLCCVIAGRLFAVHGGLSPELNRLDQIRRLTLPMSVPESDCLISDLLWSDPHPYVKGFARNNRGISFVFGADIVERFCHSNGLDMIVRGHQVFPQGYEFFANKKLVTVFSAPAYHEEFDNSAALLNVASNLSCSLRLLKPSKSVVKSRRSQREKSDDE